MTWATRFLFRRHCHFNWLSIRKDPPRALLQYDSVRMRSERRRGTAAMLYIGASSSGICLFWRQQDLQLADRDSPIRPLITVRLY